MATSKRCKMAAYESHICVKINMLHRIIINFKLTQNEKVLK